MADEDPVRLSSTPSSRSSNSSGSEEAVQSSSIDLASSTSPRKANSGFQCKLCTLVASSQSALDEHMNIHTGSRPYQCLECGFSCSLQSTLSQHLAVHRVEMSSSVLMRSPSVEEMQKSPRDQPPSLYPEVPRTLSLPSTAPQMIHSEELIPVPAPVGVFPDQSRIFQCKLCTHISPTKTHLNEHMNIHSGKKPYKCLVCGFSSAFRSSLMRHLIVHTGTSKQFKCDQCHYQTPYKCNLQAHRRKRHNSVENSEIPETTVATSLPEISKVSTPNSNHSDDSQSGVGIYPPSEMSSIGFPFSHAGQGMGNDRDNLSNGPSEERHDEAQENTTSGTTEILAGNENGYSNSSSAQPIQVSVSMDDSLMTKSSPGSGPNQTQDQNTYGIDHSLSSPVTENGEVADSAVGAGASHEPTSTSASPIASLSQMATSHSPLVQTSGNENLPVSSIWPTNAGFPIFIKKKKEGAKKRKRTPLPKRDFVMSPEQEMWIDTRSEGKSIIENQRPYFFNLPGTNVKTEDDHSIVYHDQNGLDLSTVAVARDGVRSASAEGQLNNHNSPVGISSLTQEDGDDKNVYPFHVYNQVGIPGRPHAKVSTGTQTDQSVLKEKADGQSNIGSDIPPQASKCPHCETYFTDTVMFTLHMSCHGRIHPFQCGICGYMCGDKIEFTCHITRSKHLR